VAKELPSRSGSIRRLSAVLATAAAGALLLAGCAAGQDAQTIAQRPPIDGASANAGGLSIRTAAIVASPGDSYSQGSSALLQLVIINNGATDRTLTQVTSSVAGSAVVSNAGVPVAAASDSSAASASSGASPSPSDTSSPASTSSSSSSTASGSAAQSEPIRLPAGQSVQIGFSPTGPNIQLNSLTASLYPAQTVPVTFGFDDGTSVTVDLTVQLQSSPPSAPVVSVATEPVEQKG
jgi:copper(I)-binding protein